MDAFGVTTPNLDALHFGENAAVSDVLGDLFRRDPKWVLAVEERCKMVVLGRSRGGASGGSAMKVHVFCPMLKEKRDAVRLIAERWKLSISAAGWEPKRFIVVHATQKSKPPARVLGAKGVNQAGAVHPPGFDPLVDMDPRLVVALFDLPSDADVSALVLRFGGECELVWLNDKNALAVFSDPARAATAMRRLDHGSVYYGAAVVGVVSNGGGNVWGGGAVAKDQVNPWKKAVVQEVAGDWGQSSWSVSDEWGGGGGLAVKEAPIAASANRWSALESEGGGSLAEESGKVVVVEGETAVASGSSGGAKEDENLDVVEDWEKAYD